jgi:hypothetical protein
MNEIEIHERSMPAFWERQMLSVPKTFAQVLDSAGKRRYNGGGDGKCSGELVVTTKMQEVVVKVLEPRELLEVWGV